MHATFLPAKRTGAQGPIILLFMLCREYGVPVNENMAGQLITSLLSDSVGLLSVTSTKMHGSGCPLFVLALLPAFQAPDRNFIAWGPNYPDIVPGVKDGFLIQLIKRGGGGGTFLPNNQSRVNEGRGLEPGNLPFEQSNEAGWVTGGSC